MNPRPYVRLIAAATALATVGALAVAGSAASAALAGCVLLGSAIAFPLALRYRVRRDGPRSAIRRAGDREMGRCLAIGLLLPLALCAAAARLGMPFESPAHGSAAIAISCCAVLIPLSILVSSTVDWYLIRPFREGLQGPPACVRDAQDPKATNAYARYWVLHRGICEFVVYGALCGIVAISFSAVLVGTDDPVLTGAIGLLGFGGVAWAYTKMRPLAEHAVNFVRFPGAPGLGAWAAGRNAAGEPIEGFLVDVSIEPGVQLIAEPVGPPAAARTRTGDEPVRRCVALKDRGTLRAAVAPRPLCPGGRCEFWIPECEVGLLALEAARGEEEPSAPVSSPA